MIKFFRKIRKQLLSENKFSKYLIYAIGEIVLVVLGILIALSLNNWNQKHENIITEIELLNSLYDDLNVDKQMLTTKMNIDSIIARSNKELLFAIQKNNLNPIIKRVENKPNAANSFGSMNRLTFFYPQRFAYEAIKFNGIGIIENKDLRQKIVNLYDFRYKVTEAFQQVQLNLNQDTNQNLWEHLETGNDITFKIPNDTTKLKSDQKFTNVLSHLSEQYREAYDFYKINMTEINLLLSLVEKEIEIKSK
jgi:hypothetical protein